MKSNIRTHVWAFAAVVGATLACLVFPALAGPVVLMGIDGEDGNGGLCGSGGGAHGGHAPYIAVANGFLPLVTNGGTGILVIGGGKSPTDNVTQFWNAVGCGVTPPQPVTHVNGAGNIGTVAIANYRMIAIASSQQQTPSGGLTQAESDALDARAADIAGFVNTGGALFGLSQAGLSTPYGYLGTIGSFTSAFPPQYADVTATAAGMAVGITNTNMDVCCWHDTFPAFPSFLQVLAFHAGNGQAAALGGANVAIPGQITLSPLLSFNPPGTSHTVSAVVLDALPPNNPVPNVDVTFTVTTGPNAGATSVATTDGTGTATFTYTDGGPVGVDQIVGSFVSGGNTITSTPVRKFWDLDCNLDNVPDSCNIDCAGFSGNCNAFLSCGGSADTNGDGVPDECNTPPVCHSNGPYIAECGGAFSFLVLDASGSSDPDNDRLTYLWTSDCPGAVFDDPTSATPLLTIDTSGGVPLTCNVSVTVTDPSGASDSCASTVTVEDTTPPTVVVGPMTLLWPPNHKYHVFDLAGCAMIEDACEGSMSAATSAVISCIYSDEPEDVGGYGDGNTLTDIVILGPTTFMVRAERQGKGNGRVYGVTYSVTDSAGNSTEATCYFGVPHDQSGPLPVNDGPAAGYAVGGGCP